MKKLIPLILAPCFLFLTACGGTPENETTDFIDPVLASIQDLEPQIGGSISADRSIIDSGVEISIFFDAVDVCDLGQKVKDCTTKVQAILEAANESLDYLYIQAKYRNDKNIKWRSENYTTGAVTDDINNISTSRSSRSFSLADFEKIYSPENKNLILISPSYWSDFSSDINYIKDKMYTALGINKDSISIYALSVEYALETAIDHYDPYVIVYDDEENSEKINIHVSFCSNKIYVISQVAQDVMDFVESMYETPESKISWIEIMLLLTPTNQSLFWESYDLKTWGCYDEINPHLTIDRLDEAIPFSEMIAIYSPDNEDIQ